LRQRREWGGMPADERDRQKRECRASETRAKTRPRERAAGLALGEREK
jgi:hypothetical protein